MFDQRALQSADQTTWSLSVKSLGKESLDRETGPRIWRESLITGQSINSVSF